MQDKTPIYMLVIVAIVAVVGIIVMMVNNAPAQATSADGSSITGNVVASQAPSVTLFGKIFFIVFLMGVAGYMYFSKPK